VVNFFKRQAVVPFETCFAFYSIYAGVAGILDFGVTNVAFRNFLGLKFSLLFNLAYALAGTALFVGIGTNRRNLETFGIILILTSLAVRILISTHYLGFNSAVLGSYVFAAAFSFSCVVRLVLLLRGYSIALVESPDEILKDLSPHVHQ
jgi:hypothetical protein